MPATLVLLPGLDGTAAFFQPLLAALPGWIRPVVVTYPSFGPNDYLDLLPLAERAIGRGGPVYVLGWSFGGPLARQFYLSSFDTLRGVPYGNQDFLLGRHFLFSTAELQVPLNGVIRVLILNDIEAVAGIDFGGVGQSWEQLWAHRVLSPVVGGNFALGPLILRLHFAKPIDIGAPAGLPSNNGEWVTNFSIRILGFEGFFDRRFGTPGGVHQGSHNTFVGTRSGAAF